MNGSHKYKGNSKDVKPPDLWIHHERLELKPIDKSPDPNPIMTDTPIPRNSQDITPVDNSMDSNIHQRRNSYRGTGFFHLNHFPFCKVALIGNSYEKLGLEKHVLQQQLLMQNSWPLERERLCTQTKQPSSSLRSLIALHQLKI